MALLKLCDNDPLVKTLREVFRANIIRIPEEKIRPLCVVAARDGKLAYRGRLADLIPGEPTIATLQEAATGCTACPLYRNSTQTVFGEGPELAAIMLVGEQPGDAEDLAGHPFVGPAGKLMDRCLAEAGIDRSRTYVTNVVKHFKWVPRGPRRIHSKPGAVEIEALSG